VGSFETSIGVNFGLIQEKWMLPSLSSFLAAALLLGVSSSQAQVNVLTYHNDLSRTGQNLNETILTPSSLATGNFSPLFSAPVDGQVYSQPLYMWGVNMPGKGVHNVVFVATEHDSVYAFDADSNTGSNAAPLWQTSFLNPSAGVTSVPADNLGCKVITPEVGITGTPVIDPSTGTLYVVAMTLEDFGQTYVHRLHALDVTTGLEKPGSPVDIEASAPGTGDGNSTVTFRPGLYKERAGLLLVNGVVYTFWSSHCDAGSYHGWVIGYDANTLKRTAVYTSTPNWDAGSIWQSGAAPPADADGNIYIVTGNGTFDADRGGADLGDSVVKLSTTHALSVADYFTPFNAALLDVKDIDLGSSGALLLPDLAGSTQHPHLLITGGKEGRIYLIDRDAMGHFASDSDQQIVQSLPAAVGPLFGVPAYYNKTIFFGPKNDALKAFRILNGQLSETPSSQSSGVIPYLGSIPSVSANGWKSGIVWTICPDGLHAYDAADLANELYRGNVDSYIKFSTPTIANGKVYVATMSSVAIFGLPNAPAIARIVNAAGSGAPPVAAGSIISVYGMHLAPDAILSINGIAAPLLSASPGQINAQIPYEIDPGTAAVVVTRGDSASSSVALQIQKTAPGIFGADPNHPTPGSVLVLYATGLGPTEPPVATGVAAPLGPSSIPTLPLSATLASQPAAILRAELVPGLVGVFRVTLELPTLPPGTYPLVIQSNGISSNPAQITIFP
jgi:uncharacterized protein (TIGR03437 family)